jgi:hypothetical protein
VQDIAALTGGDQLSLGSTQGRRTNHQRVATTLATQSLASDRTRQHSSDDAPDVSSEDAPR